MHLEFVVKENHTNITIFSAYGNNQARQDIFGDDN